MTEKRNQLAMCVDEGYALPLAVSLASLDAAPGADCVTVHILHPGLATVTMGRLTAGLKHLDVRWLEIDDSAVHGAHYSNFLSSGSLYRLLIDDLLPPEIERVLYLDADTLIVESLRDLFEVDLKGRVLGAVRDSNTPWAACTLGSSWRELGLDPSTPYFNSGIMLIDMQRWRDEKVGRRCLELLRGITPRWGDQDALNSVLRGAWHELPRRWNLQTPELTGDSPGWALWRPEVEAAIDEPAIVHLTGLDKPWDYGSEHPYRDHWLEYLDRTAFAGWRPQAPSESRVESWARLAVRYQRQRRSERHRRRTAPAGLKTTGK